MSCLAGNSGRNRSAPPDAEPLTRSPATGLTGTTGRRGNGSRDVSVARCTTGLVAVGGGATGAGRAMGAREGSTAVAGIDGSGIPMGDTGARTVPPRGGTDSAGPDVRVSGRTSSAARWTTGTGGVAGGGASRTAGASR
jgi:hypothetical protein